MKSKHGGYQRSRLKCVVAGAGSQAGADVADDVGGKAAQVVPADLAALAWPALMGEVGGVDGDAGFFECFTGGCRREGLAFAEASSRQ